MNTITTDQLVSALNWRYATKVFDPARKPATVAEHRSDAKSDPAHRVPWDDITKVMYNHGAVTSHRCGLHVHIDSRAMSRLTRGKLLVMLNTDNIEMRSKIEWVARRGANRYCDPVPKKSCADMPQGRYEPVNVTNFGTVEIRIFRSSRRPHWIKACVEFCDALVRYLPGCSVKHVENWARFEDWLFVNRGEFPFLIPYLDAQGALDNPARFASKPTKDSRTCV